MTTIDDKQFIFHIGLHKTASTYLQNRVFPALSPSGIYYVDKYDDFTMALVQALRRGVIGQDAGIRAHIRERFRGVRQGRVLISSEALSGWPYGGYCDDFVSMTEGLAHLFPAASIVLVVRNQIDWMVSLYKHSLRNGLIPFKEFLNGEVHRPAEPALDKDRVADALAFDFSRLHRVCARTFGDDKVHVLFFEELEANAGRFLSRLSGILDCEFVGTIDGKPENRGYSSFLLAAVNRLPVPRQRLARRLLHVLIRLPVLRGMNCSEALVGREAATRLRQHYARCNEHLAAFMPSDDIREKYYLAGRT
jgi:hypothetical protein